MHKMLKMALVPNGRVINLKKKLLYLHFDLENTLQFNQVFLVLYTKASIFIHVLENVEIKCDTLSFPQSLKEQVYLRFTF